MNAPLRLVDPRYFQVGFQLLFLLYGLIFLEWSADWLHYAVTITACLLITYLFECYRLRNVLFIKKVPFTAWGLSVLISALSLCLLLKTNHWQTSFGAAFFTVASKYLIRYKGRHMVNPSAFGIVAALLLTNDAWLSPGQWGSTVIIFFAGITLGTIVVTRVQKLDVSLAFLVTYIGLLYWRQLYVLGWPADYFVHSVTTGSLLLFSFFMISDPKTAPDHKVARIVWAVLIALISFYFSAFQWKYNTPIWVLVGAAPLVPLFNKLCKARSFQWTTNLQPGIGT